MKKLLLTLPVALFCAASLTGCRNESQVALLWEISGNGLEKSSYVLPLIEETLLSDMDNVAGFRQAYDSCEQIINCVYYLHPDNPQYELWISYGNMPADTTYRDILPEEEYDRFARLVDEIMPESFRFLVGDFMEMRPYTFYGLLNLRKQVQTNPNWMFTKSVNQLFDEDYISGSKKIVSLGTFDTLLNYTHYSAPMQQQVRDVIRVMENISLYDSLTNRIYEQYKRGDLDGALATTGEYIETFLPEDDLEEGIVRRAKDYYPSVFPLVPEVISRAPSFIAADIRLVAGEDGLLEYLRHHGYTVSLLE